MDKSLQKIVVARYKADISWLDKLPGWIPIVIQKQTEELEGDMPNVGREPGAFCQAIMNHYDDIRSTDVWAFVQDNPFDHCLDLELLLSQPCTSFRWLGGKTLKESDGNGGHDHPNLPVAEYYERWTGRKWFEDKRVLFAPGGQFMVTGLELLQHPKAFYWEMRDDVSIEWNAWVAERLWESIFTNNYDMIGSNVIS